MVAVEIIGGAREPAGQLGLVAGVEAREHRLVVALGRLVRLVEALEERVHAFARPAPEVELRFPLGDADEPDEMHLRILGEGAVEELELPVRPARDVENAIRPGPAVHDDGATVVGQGRLGGQCRVRQRALLGLRTDAQFVEGDAGLLGFQLEAEGRRLAAAGGLDELLNRLALLVEDLRHDRSIAVAGCADFRLDRHGRILEDRLAHRALGDGHVAQRVVPADDHGINRRKPGQVRQPFREIRGDAVGQQHDTGDGLALGPFGDGTKRPGQSGGAAIEAEFREIPRRLQPRIEGVATDLERVFQITEPAGTGTGDELAEKLAPRLGRARVLHEKSQRIVRHDGQLVRTRPGALARPDGFEQAEQQRDDGEQFQEESRQANAVRRVAAAVAPCEEGHGGREDGDGKPQGFRSAERDGSQGGHGCEAGTPTPPARTRKSKDGEEALAVAANSSTPT